MKKLLAIFLCVIWMGFIFYNSSNSGEISEGRSHALLSSIRNEYYKFSNGDISSLQNEQLYYNNLKTSKISAKEKLNIVKSIAREEKLNYILRKNAHAFEYFILAILVSAILFSLNMKGRGALIYIMFICLFYAVTDEFHQAFIPGRTSLVSDVLIDFLGSLMGMAVFYLFYYKIFKTKIQKNSPYVNSSKLNR